MKPEILYISDSFKEANYFLSDVIKELSDRGSLILDFCRKRLILETEYAKLRCVPMNSHDLFATRFNNTKYFMKGSKVIKSEFDERVSFRLNSGAKEIMGHQELLSLLSGRKILR